MDEIPPATGSASRSALLLPAALAMAVIALLLAVWSFVAGRDGTQSLTEMLATRLAEQGSSQKQTAAQLEQTAKELRDAQNRLAQLEGKLAEFQGQRVAMEEMYRELSRAPDDWLLAEIEQTLNIASRELTLAGNVRAALIAMQSIDQRLSRADKLQVLQLRRAIVGRGGYPRRGGAASQARFALIDT